jgi:MSHA biogenesis protein MshQ
MNVKNKISRCLIVCLLGVLSLFSSVAFSVTEEIRVSSKHDDAEELISDGNMYRDSSDLELGYDDYAGGLQIVGMRFQSVNIPQGATINSAYIDFETDETDSGATNLVIFGENNDNPNQFANNDNNISDRTKTSASVNWTPLAWNSTNELNKTPDISVIIQEIVNRANWAASNNLVLIVEPGSGCTTISCQRTAESHDGESNSAPLLVINYTVAPTKLSVAIENVIQEYDVDSYGGSSQDRTGTVEIRDAGLSLYLEGNRWQKIDFPYTVTADTMIEFDFQSTVQGEINGLGFDNDLGISDDKSFRVYGTQNWGISNFATYPGSGVTHFTIPVGQFYTGDFDHLFFINDDDSNPTGNSLYSNIVVYEKYLCNSIVGELNAVGIKIGGGSGFNSQINTTTEALNIYAAWLAAGSNFSDSINSGGNSYNVTASGSSTVDRIDFGGSTHDFSETLPYPGVVDGVNGEDFLVHASGKLSLPAGDYTIFVEADDGFSFIMDTLSGDTVSFTKFGSSSAGVSNELRFENPTANSNTGGSFTLTQDSVFDIAAIFFERGGGDYLEISIANNIRSNAAPSGYEILKHDALGGKVKFGQCSVTPQIDHYEIIHDSQGLTCDAESITVKACSNADCTTPYTESVDVQLSVNGIVNKTITVLNGTSDTTFVHALANTATLSLDETYICKVNGAQSNCDVLFSDTGFRFFSGIEGTPIPTQLSGKPSNLGFNASTLKLQAIEKNTETGACQAALIDSVNIEMAATCSNPSTCAGQKVIINNTIDNISVDTLNSTAALTYTTVPLDFANTTANSAPFILTYPEAGSMQLHARYNIPDELGNSTGIYMLGSSNPFVVRPFGFSIAVKDTNNIQNPAAVDHNGAVFMSAGDIFTTTIKAVQWKTEQDSNNDGIPDDTDNIASNLITANFGNEITPETVEITHTLYLPKPATLGDLSNNSFNFNNGIASNSNMTYSEVGIISFTANLHDNTYLTANDISGNAPYVGRFTPENFALSVDKEGSFVSVCEGIDIDMPFAYSGQMSIVDPSKGVLRYLEQPEILITPKSKLGNHTKNYTGNFNKLTLSGISRFMIDDGTGTLVLAPISDTTQLGADETKKVRLTSNFDDGILTEGENENVGILSFQYNDLDDFFYLHEENSEIPPFTSDINLAIASIIDGDTVTAIDADGAIDTDGDGIINATNDTVITLNPSGKEIRFGRAYLANSFGPETTDLPQPLFVQYLDAVDHYKNTVDDTCTAFDSSKVALTTIDFDRSKTGVKTVSGQFFNGETKEIELLAPSDGIRGDLGVEYDIYPWLEYDWDWSGTGPKLYDQNPSAIATFGLFRGNDRIIYMREVF